MIQQGPEEEPANQAEPVSELEDIASLKQRLDEEKVKAEQYLANWQRAQADLINYKRRTEQEKGEISTFANTTLMFSLLPVLDDLERAFAAIPQRLVKLNWVDGIKLIDRKLRAGLEAQGLSEIKAVGEPFDPHLHEAVRQDKGEEGIVIEEMQKGYKFRDRVIRPTKAVVGNGEEEKERKEE